MLRFKRNTGRNFVFSLAKRVVFFFTSFIDTEINVVFSELLSLTVSVYQLCPELSDPCCERYKISLAFFV